MFDPKIKIPKPLMEKIKSASERSGCSSVDEFITNVLEKEADRINNQTQAKTGKKDDEIIKNRLKGLGYID